MHLVVKSQFSDATQGVSKRFAQLSAHTSLAVYLHSLSYNLQRVLVASVNSAQGIFIHVFTNLQCVNALHAVSPVKIDAHLSRQVVFVAFH
jgi:hypothetical protein